MTKLVVTLAVIAGLVAIGVALAFLWARRNPLLAFEKMTRSQLKRSGMQRNSFQLAGEPVVYWTGGTGAKTIVLVHGVNDQAGTWAGLGALLARNHRVVAVDLPGHGESGPKGGALPMRNMIDALSAVIDRSSPDAPVVLVGNSMGGWVSMLYASEKPERVQRLILENASGMAWDLSHVPIAPKDRDEARKLLRMVQGPDAPLPDYLLDAMIRMAPALPQARVLQAPGLAEWIVDARLAKLTMPVTLIWGRQDGLLPMKYAETLASRLPNAKLEIVDRAAHIPHRQAPAEFARLLLAALPEAVAGGH
jgi:pimeloyl-ACP methyl ester carboxylesterase